MPIHELPKELATKIAAGEVIERPMSVVKELIENSIDAGAKEILIRIEQAGRRLIEVEDNGIGIPPDEIKLAIRRYATSKINSIEDLENVRSLGFRGEALASIAAVSRFNLESRISDNDGGHQLSVDGGSIQDFRPVGMKPGTRIKVENLFFNVPARQKFLKKDITERKLIIELISREALYYSEIRFQLQQEGRPSFTSYGNGNRREILSKIFNLEAAKNFLDIDYQNNFIAIRGYTSPINFSYANRKQIFCFVNGRLISDPTLTAAIIRSYHGYLMVGRFPSTILFIDISPDQVDVNVHPTKDEIRFQDSARIFAEIHAAVRKTITELSPPQNLVLPNWNTSTTIDGEFSSDWNFSEELDQGSILTPSPVEHQSETEKPLIFGSVPILRLIGQLGRMYIAAEGPDGLYLIDQHAAHERILFEKIQNSMQKKVISQFLLHPEVLKIPDNLVEEFEQQKLILKKLGFKFEEFGRDTIRITALPDVIQKMNPTEAVLGALETNDEQKEALKGEYDKKIITNICKKAAIKGGQLLSSQEQEQLIRELENCRSPRTCPHGRPTMIHISVDLLERQFGRRGSR